MSVGRIAAAVAAALCVLYIRFSMPVLYQTAAPAVREALGEEQIVFRVSQETLAWLRGDG